MGCAREPFQLLLAMRFTSTFWPFFKAKLRDVAALWAIFGLIDAEGAQAEQRANAEGTPAVAAGGCGGAWGVIKKGIGWQGR